MQQLKCIEVFIVSAETIKFIDEIQCKRFMTVIFGRDLLGVKVKVQTREKQTSNV